MAAAAGPAAAAAVAAAVVVEEQEAQAAGATVVEEEEGEEEAEAAAAQAAGATAAAAEVEAVVEVLEAAQTERHETAWRAGCGPGWKRRATGWVSCPERRRGRCSAVEVELVGGRLHAVCMTTAADGTAAPWPASHPATVERASPCPTGAAGVSCVPEDPESGWQAHVLGAFLSAPLHCGPQERY